MSPVLQPMTFEELSQIHREEMKGKSLTSVRPDLYRAMADLLNRLRQEYDKQISIDPDSVMSEGANLQRKKAETLTKVILNVRASKICKKAVLSADGAAEDINALTPEEKEYYFQVVERSKKELSLVDHYRGKKTVTAHIDEPISRPEPPAEPKPEPVEAPAAEEPPITEEMFDEPMEESFDDIPEPDEFSPQVEESQAEAEPVAEPPAGDTILIRVLEDLPPFVGPDRNYELHKEDVVTLPASMADILIRSQKAIAIVPGL